MAARTRQCLGCHFASLSHVVGGTRLTSIDRRTSARVRCWRQDGNGGRGSFSNNGGPVRGPRRVVQRPLRAPAHCLKAAAASPSRRRVRPPISLLPPRATRCAPFGTRGLARYAPASPGVLLPPRRGGAPAPPTRPPPAPAESARHSAARRRRRHPRRFCSVAALDRPSAHARPLRAAR